MPKSWSWPKMPKSWSTGEIPGKVDSLPNSTMMAITPKPQQAWNSFVRTLLEITKYGLSCHQSSNSPVGDTYDSLARGSRPITHGSSITGIYTSQRKGYTLSWSSFGCRDPKLCFTTG